MPFIQTEFPGLMIYEPNVFSDARGYFLESFNAKTFAAAGTEVQFVQDNESMSNYGVVRGLHFQKPPYAQAKLVRVVKGEVLDVVLDIRKGSPTYGRTFELLLSEENKKMLFIPRGFAHGFSVLRNETIFSYKCDNFYHRESEGGVSPTDPALQIDWRLPREVFILSEKDQNSPTFSQLISEFNFAL
ncbi:MAG: dTDP-4-dehydrorhamnose 3,5-epimerase [Chitinophagales bacterium]